MTMINSPSSPADLPPAKARNDQRVPYPNPGWARLVSFLLAVGLSVLVFAYPRAFAVAVGDVRHGMLALLMFGIAGGFVHGVGFVPRLNVWRIAFHPLLSWPLMVLGIIWLIFGH